MGRTRTGTIPRYALFMAPTPNPLPDWTKPLDWLTVTPPCFCLVKMYEGGWRGKPQS